MRIETRNRDVFHRVNHKTDKEITVRVIVPSDKFPFIIFPRDGLDMQTTVLDEGEMLERQSINQD